ncbi:hypothetical protein NNC19_05110 [Clostridium sp. SHJSY1]|uniref:hypothetical protein n=1 Tax=Clostridium sp. SHJSY1 TaxID=2942483 RepID=UPI0028760CF1|nr:hypothetical protein [Clostridium sp. SHJSY1]MDS0525052.1 hypothetical protein [Clostridium sp. SHJSY1]
MGKPSIFSKDYERRMKKRKKSIILIVLLVVVTMVVLIYNSGAKNMDFSNLKAKIQAWVDNGKPQEKVTKVEEDKTKEPKEEAPEEKPQEKQESYVDINVSPGVVIKAQYEEKDGKRQFVKVDSVQGYTFNISPSKGQLLILDSAQNMKVSNTEGVIKDITKTAYVSQAGSTFPKDQILANDPTYTWHSEAKFIDDSKVVYVSELPYFNKGKKKYLWIYDLGTNSDKIIWSVIGSEIKVGDVVPEKGITITVDGVVSYLKADETITN